MDKFKTQLEHLGEKLYDLNRRVSTGIMIYSKDIKKQHKLRKINRMIAEVIKECREGDE